MFLLIFFDYIFFKIRAQSNFDAQVCREKQGLTYLSFYGKLNSR